MARYESPSAEELRDRAALSDVLIRFACSMDARDWPAYRSCFADSIEIDYRSLIGGEILSETGDAWAERTRESFAGFDVTQHLSTNHVHRVEGDRAHSTAYICAEHFVTTKDAQESWTLGGIYRAEFARSQEGWKIERLALDVLWTRGNPDVFALAAKKAALEDPVAQERTPL